MDPTTRTVFYKGRNRQNHNRIRSKIIRKARALHCASRRACGARNHSFAPSPSTYPFSAQARLGPCWANFTTRLTALSVGVVRWNARADFFLKRDGICSYFPWRSIKSKARTPLELCGAGGYCHFAPLCSSTVLRVWVLFLFCRFATACGSKELIL
jgi:hypothetical protein